MADEETTATEDTEVTDTAPGTAADTAAEAPAEAVPASDAEAPAAAESTAEAAAGTKTEAGTEATALPDAAAAAETTDAAEEKKAGTEAEAEDEAEADAEAEDSGAVDENGRKLTEIIGVAFKEGGKVYYFGPEEGVEYAKGDGVIVETSRGVEYATITLPRTFVDDSMIVKPLRTVMRSATPEDTEKYQANLARKDEAMQIVRERIEKFGLDMKLLDCEFAFDGTKVIFYYSAPQRVDFRDLVKNLSGIFRMRIELRQIGIRDEIKLYGGLAPCGRECCCARCVTDLKKVSIKMAKNQGLSLNPTKISGLCGRLMCCLAYENDYYADACQHMPKVGSVVTTPDGEGTVNSLNMLKLEVSVRIEDKAKDLCTYKSYSVKDIQFDGADGYFDTLDEEPEVHEDHTEDLHVHEEPYEPEAEEVLADEEFPPEEEPAPAPKKEKKKKKKKPQGKTPAPYAHMSTKQKQAAAAAAAAEAAEAAGTAAESPAPAPAKAGGRKKQKGSQPQPQGQIPRQDTAQEAQAPKQNGPRQGAPRQGGSQPKQGGQNQPKKQKQPQNTSGEPKQAQAGSGESGQQGQKAPRQGGQSRSRQNNGQFGGQQNGQPQPQGGQAPRKKNRGQGSGQNGNNGGNPNAPKKSQQKQASQGEQAQGQGNASGQQQNGKPRNKKKHSGSSGPKAEGGNQAPSETAQN
ncbi:MAG: hypothetical protein LUD51_00065 [Clostridia bacterium]|nr:hypothetical protein [Clostridia bacterium]